MTITAIADNIRTAHELIAEGDTHRAEQYARSAHSAAVERVIAGDREAVTLMEWAASMI